MSLDCSSFIKNAKPKGLKRTFSWTKKFQALQKKKNVAKTCFWTTRPHQFGYQYAEVPLLVIILKKW